MRLTECVSTADIRTLRAIAQHYEFPCSLHSKHELMQEIIFAFSRKEFLEEQVTSWMRTWDTVYVRLCLSQRSTFSAEEIEALFQSKEPRGVGRLETAKAQGWLFYATNRSRDSFYVIPEEILKAMRSHLVAEWSERVEISVDGPLVYHDEELALSRDLDIFMEYIVHHEVQLTTGGAMYKRYLIQVLALFEVEEPLVEGGWRFGYGRRFHDYPARLALLYDFAFHKGFIEETSDGFLCATEKWADFRGASMHKRQEQLVNFYVSLYRRPIPRLPQILQVIRYISERWTKSESAFQSLSSLVNSYYYDEAIDVWTERIVTMMRHLGLIRAGDDEQGQTWFQITKLGLQLITPDGIVASDPESQEQERVLILQPNFEIFVTADHPRVVKELAKFTELRESGKIRLYRISEGSILRGLSAGESLGDWMEFVQTFAETPMPGNVERMLLEWERQYLESSDEEPRHA